MSPRRSARTASARVGTPSRAPVARIRPPSPPMPWPRFEPLPAVPRARRRRESSPRCRRNERDAGGARAAARPRRRRRPILERPCGQGEWRRRSLLNRRAGEGRAEDGKGCHLAARRRRFRVIEGEVRIVTSAAVNHGPRRHRRPLISPPTGRQKYDRNGMPSDRAGPGVDAGERLTSTSSPASSRVSARKRLASPPRFPRSRPEGPSSFEGGRPAARGGPAGRVVRECVHRQPRELRLRSSRENSLTPPRVPGDQLSGPSSYQSAEGNAGTGPRRTAGRAARRPGRSRSGTTARPPGSRGHSGPDVANSKPDSPDRRSSV